MPAWRLPGLSVLQAELLKPDPVCLDRLRIKVENRPDLVVGRDWIEVTRLAEQTTASGNGISGIRASDHNPLSFKPSMQFIDVGCHSWKMEKKTNILNFGTTLRMSNDN
jgi:hypothetical protein